MRRVLTLVVIFIISFFTAGILAPPDATSCFLFTGVFFIWGATSYLIGIREGKKLSHLADNKT
jgi:hypothetical protein